MVFRHRKERIRGLTGMKMRYPLILFTGIACAVVLSGCREGGDETDFHGMNGDRRYSIVLITLDTFRADHLSCLNDSSPPTPTLDSLAASGVCFTEAFTANNCTNPSHVSIMSGLYCLAHRVYGNSHGLSSEALTVAEALAADGYHTMGSVSIPHLNPMVSNLGQGFEYFLPSRLARGEPADQRTTAVVEFLRQKTPEVEEPWFLWIHYFDPHTPYEPPEPFDSAYPTQRQLESIRYEGGMGLVPYNRTTKMVIDPTGQLTRYRGEVAFLDGQLARLMKELRALRGFETPYVVVVGDHGEGLGEHDFYFQHASMFGEVLRVPLILSGPEIPEGRIIPTPVSTVDVFPTILSLAHHDSLPFSHGLSLLSLIADPNGAHHEGIIAESVGDWVKSVWTADRAFIWNDPRKQRYWKLPGRIVLVDRRPVEVEIPDPPIQRKPDVMALRTIWSDVLRDTPLRYERYAGDTDMDQLKALGYVE